MPIHVKDLRDSVLNYYATAALEDLQKDLSEFLNELDMKIYHVRDDGNPSSVTQ